VMKKENILAKIPVQLPNQLVESVSQSKNAEIKRIIFKANATHDKEWRSQNKNDFVFILVLQGNTTIEFENKEKFELKEGDYVIIPKDTKHRVASTSKDKETIWLAVFY
jgi:cupin 2 domain-containing protein